MGELRRPLKMVICSFFKPVGDGLFAKVLVYRIIEDCYKFFVIMDGKTFDFRGDRKEVKKLLIEVLRSHFLTEEWLVSKEFVGVKWS
jgi:hypothetical protein